MSSMSLYSFNHDSFGKTTNRPGAAGDNARYNSDLTKTQYDAFLAANAQYLKDHATHRPEAEIEAHLAELRQGRSAAENAAYNAREEAVYAIRSHVIPASAQEAAGWFDEQERKDRKNARMSDRFIGALPRELTPEQCIAAVEKFCRDITQDRVPWHFALHLELDKKHEPDWNPHAHIIFRDRDIETGQRVLYTTAGAKERKQFAAKGIKTWSTRDFREEWANQMNGALERAGLDIRVDHRSLKDQGIDRTPQIHIGPASQHAAKKGRDLKSQNRQQGERTVRYTEIDQGTRADFNAAIIETNQRAERDKARANRRGEFREAGRGLTGAGTPDNAILRAEQALASVQGVAVPDSETNKQRRQDRGAQTKRQARDRPPTWAEKAVLAARENTLTGGEFLAEIGEAGITLARVTAEDIALLKAEHTLAFSQDKEVPYVPPIIEGDLAAITTTGKILPLSALRLGSAAEYEQRLAADGFPLPSVLEARDSALVIHEGKQQARDERQQAWEARQIEWATPSGLTPTDVATEIVNVASQTLDTLDVNEHDLVKTAEAALDKVTDVLESFFAPEPPKPEKVKQQEIAREQQRAATHDQAAKKARDDEKERKIKAVLQSYGFYDETITPEEHERRQQLEKDRDRGISR